MKSTRIRWAYVAGAGAACAAVIVAGTVAANAAITGNRGAVTFDAGATPSAVVSSAPAEEPSSAPAPARRLGDVIDSGFPAKGGAWVFYAVRVSDLHDVNFGIMAGVRSPKGTLTDKVLTNETEGTGRTPGFHAVEGGMGLDVGVSPTFGYYVGPAARITGQVKGRTVTAHQARWSEESSVVVFWFKPGTGTVRGLKAYDTAGKRLPTGNAQIGVG